MIKLLIGGSPCTYWSIAQKNNRETEAEGLGWELFKNYLIAKEKFKPDFFLYENNKSAAQAIKDQIKKELCVWDGTLFSEDSGARYIEINSALVSAQNRQRFYVHNCGNVEQPEDRGIVLRDILESGENLSPNEKSYALTTRCAGAIPEDTITRHRHTMVAEPCIIQKEHGYNKGGIKYDKAPTITGNGSWQNNNHIIEPVAVNAMNGSEKCRTLTANYWKTSVRDAFVDCAGGRTMVAEPVGVGSRNRREEDGKLYRRFETHGEEKANALTTVQTDSMVAEPIRIGDIGSTSQAHRVYSCDGKSVTINAGGGGQGGKTGLYACPATGKEMPVYEVKNGLITIKGKQYPIKLADGYYIIRKLTPIECERLQTLPDNYTVAVSNAQRYKGLGNGWTAEVIIHILNGALKDVPRDEEIIVLSMYDGIGTGRYCRKYPHALPGMSQTI